MLNPLFHSGTILSVLAVAALGTCGCSQQSAPTDSTTQSTDAARSDHAAASVDDHSGWWCAEHGVPESECSICSSKVAAAFKAKGDWCEEHQRAESQCFLCSPSRAEKFKKLYVAKYGKEPPAMAE